MTPKIIQLPKLEDNRGNLSFIEESNHIPFQILRTYWIYDIPGGQIREGHAFRKQEEFIIALSGSFDIKIDTGKNTNLYHMNRTDIGLYIPSGIWREFNNFSTNSLVLVLSSTFFDETDYIRDYDYFINKII
jgi:dTDP-4-dehydrorhamnose 3,5-epimerase-like enzyme